MIKQNSRILPVSLEETMQESYIDYAMSVIVSRALPDVRDGLKPVHRRILYAMNDLGMQSNRAYKKSARIVGEVLGKYHPHGDMAVYDAMVRMVQDFSLRYPLVDGQGNFGSIDGDSAAAMRYTEARLAQTASELLRDIDKETVNFVPNFDETLREPTVLPSLFPNLLVNGASGIAVGMATNIPPHNLREVVDGIVAYIDDPEIHIESLMQHIPAPDFPTGGIIFGMDGAREAHLTGRGRVLVRAKANVETLKNGRENIVITELPYQVNKTNLIEKIADLVKNKKIDGIYDIRDESDRDGMRLIVEMKKDSTPDTTLNQLFKHTQMQSTYGVNLLALVEGIPRVCNLKQLIQYFVEHAITVIVRRTKFELTEAEKRAHILEGLKKALDHIDAIIKLIKKSRNPETAKAGLMREFKFSEVQAKSILDMRLQRLTNLERKKIEEEYADILKLIEKLRNILASEALQNNLLKKELIRMKEKYGDDRRTDMVQEITEFNLEDMIAEEDMVITISHSGFIKRFPVSGFRRQGRGGRGSTGAKTHDEDFIEYLFVASTHHYILFFTDRGRCYWLKVHEIPQAGRAARGRSIANLLQKHKDEQIKTFIAVKEFDDNHYVVISTRKGTIKKTVLSAFRNPRKGGIYAMAISEEDELIEAQFTDGSQDIVLGTHNGLAIRFQERDVRAMGRTAAGVRGIKLSPKDYVVGMVTLSRQSSLMVVTEKGFGKRTNAGDYRLTHRGGKGIITVKTTPRVGKMICIMEIDDTDDLMIMTTQGVVIRLHGKDIRAIGRNTQGVRLIKLDENDTIADIAKVVPHSQDKINGSMAGTS